MGLAEHTHLVQCFSGDTHFIACSQLVVACQSSQTACQQDCTLQVGVEFMFNECMAAGSFSGPLGRKPQASMDSWDSLGKQFLQLISRKWCVFFFSSSLLSVMQLLTRPRELPFTPSILGPSCREQQACLHLRGGEAGSG